MQLSCSNNSGHIWTLSSSSTWSSGCSKIRFPFSTMNKTFSTCGETQDTFQHMSCKSNARPVVRETNKPAPVWEKVPSLPKALRSPTTKRNWNRKKNTENKNTCGNKAPATCNPALLGKRNTMSSRLQPTNANPIVKPWMVNEENYTQKRGGYIYDEDLFLNVWFHANNDTTRSISPHLSGNS